MFPSFKDEQQRLRNGVPGKRFRQYVDERRRHRTGHFHWGRVVSFSSGVILVLLGIGIGWLPGPGGFLALIGFALLALEIPRIADVLDSMETNGRRLIATCMRRWRKSDSPPNEDDSYS